MRIDFTTTIEDRVNRESRGRTIIVVNSTKRLRLDQIYELRKLRQILRREETLTLNDSV